MSTLISEVLKLFIPENLKINFVRFSKKILILEKDTDIKNGVFDKIYNFYAQKLDLRTILLEV